MLLYVIYRPIAFCFDLIHVLPYTFTYIIGVFFLIMDMKKKAHENADDFLMAGRSMNFFPVALSMLASILNGVFILGMCTFTI